MKPEKNCEKLSRFLQYMLGRSPDEFGLYLDSDGFCKIKLILQVLSEEEGWRHVRQGNIREIFVLINNHGLEQMDDKIRVQDRSHLPHPIEPERLPKLLYTCVRQRAYPHVCKEGITPLGGIDYVVMAADEKLAKRMGRRIDPQPVKLTIHSQNLLSNDGIIDQYGENLFLSPYVATGCFQGPPLPDERKQTKKPQKIDKPTIHPHENFGAFFPQIDDEMSKKESRLKRSKKEISWKKERREKKRR
ncbi:MAG: RNA 2'-phosphotransferase [Candidatus Magnetomorum sp.]|nr:RNA 2'-phosphotransferase [Candidatus Magnetomorum sp.]